MKKSMLFSAACAAAVVVGSGHASAQDTAPPAAPDPVPPAAPAESATPTAAPSHTVGGGEHLWGISEDRLGTGNRWVEIYVLNRDVLQNPNQIEVGQVLDIPSAPVDVPADVLAGLSAAPAATSSRSNGSATSAGSATTSSTRGSSSVSSNSSGGSGGAGGDLASIRACESGGDYQAVSGPYRGAYQFDRETWASVGGSGDPAAASPAEQDGRAQALMSQRGSSPWPNCG